MRFDTGKNKISIHVYDSYYKIEESKKYKIINDLKEFNFNNICIIYNYSDAKDFNLIKNLNNNKSTLIDLTNNYKRIENKIIGIFSMIRYALIGWGILAQKIKSISSNKNSKLVIIAGPKNKSKSCKGLELSKLFNCKYTNNWKIFDEDIDAVILSTPTKLFNKNWI